MAEADCGTEPRESSVRSGSCCDIHGRFAPDFGRVYCDIFGLWHDFFAETGISAQEMQGYLGRIGCFCCHPSYEGCGLKYNSCKCCTCLGGHPSYEGCGLKLDRVYVRSVAAEVILRMKDVDWNDKKLPEIESYTVILRMKDVDWNDLAVSHSSGMRSHPSYEGCGLKFKTGTSLPSSESSSFVWRMWIEIFPPLTC